MLLFETLSQPLIFVITLAIGFASGLLVDARNYIHFLCNKNKIVGLVLDIIVSFLCFFIMLVCVLSFNFGQLRFYFVIAFVCGLLFERFSVFSYSTLLRFFSISDNLFLISESKDNN